MKRKVLVPLTMAATVAGLFLIQIDMASSQQFRSGGGGGSNFQPTSGAKDPGVRGGAAGAGGMIGGLSASQQAAFTDGLDTFNEVDAVTDGLGPRFNMDSCAGCHAQPNPGGSSPFRNPQVDFGPGGPKGGADFLPSFITQNGPVREARFVTNPDGTPDGGVHDLFTITGHPGTGSCNLQQPDFGNALKNNNVIFRIPTPTFGAGLIEQIQDSTILANQAATANARSAAGVKGKANFQPAGNTITGQTNHNGNDGTIARFGWKAQNKSLLLFSGEAYNVEQGISNEIFQTEREEDPNCQFKAVPNDITQTDNADPRSDIERFSIFMRFLAPPVPSTTTPGGSFSISNGKKQFSAVGCSLCHTPSLKTNPNSAVAALGGQTANLYSDLLVHDMGDGLADGVSQGQAGPREFRSAPLWGLGQRIFFLHDGRTKDLMRAIQEHSSNGSEANNVIQNFNNLDDGTKQDVLNFLRSL
jgi:CxxC motif-containing protein (DUF1111 family)